MEFVASYANGCTHTTIAQGLNIPKSSLSVLLQDLLMKGYLRRTPDTGIFTTGVQVLWLANSYLRNLNLVKLGQPLVAELFTNTREFSLLAIPNGSEYVTICTESVPSIFGHTLQLGSRGPLVESAVGRAMLAFFSPPQLDEVLFESNRSPDSSPMAITHEALQRKLTETRAAGYAVARDEAVPGVTGYATPVFGSNGYPVAAFGVGVPTSQWQKAAEPIVINALTKASRILSEKLGATWPLQS